MSNLINIINEAIAPRVAPIKLHPTAGKLAIGGILGMGAAHTASQLGDYVHNIITKSDKSIVADTKPEVSETTPNIPKDDIPIGTLAAGAALGAGALGAGALAKKYFEKKARHQILTDQLSDQNQSSNQKINHIVHRK